MREFSVKILTYWFNDISASLLAGGQSILRRGKRDGLFDMPARVGDMDKSRCPGRKASHCDDPNPKNMTLVVACSANFIDGAIMHQSLSPKV